MKRLAPLLLLPVTLFAVACDAEPESDAEVAHLAGEDSEAEDGRHGPDKHGHSFHTGHHKLDRMCDMLSCTDEQRGELETIFKAQPKKTPEEREALHRTRREASRVLAAAFAGNDFSADDVAAFHEAAPGPDRHDKMAKMALPIHAVLTPEQRTLLAARLASPKGKGKHAGKRAGKKHGEARGEKRDPATRLCEAVTCSETQASQLTGIFEAHRPADGKRGPTLPAGLQERFASDAFSQADVEAWTAAMDAHRAELHGKQAQVLTEIHRILDQDQRAIVAEKLAERGPHMFKGRRGRRGHKRSR